MAKKFWFAATTPEGLWAVGIGDLVIAVCTDRQWADIIAKSLNTLRPEGYLDGDK